LIISNSSIRIAFETNNKKLSVFVIFESIQLFVDCLPEVTTNVTPSKKLNGYSALINTSKREQQPKNAMRVGIR
jgi:hypothetical protein